VYGPDGASVQIVRDGTVVTRRVEIGLHGGGLVAVLNGLVDGDLVVTKAGSFLREGDKVRPVVAAPQRITGVN
jgi:hypothetical protein